MDWKVTKAKMSLVYQADGCHRNCFIARKSKLIRVDLLYHNRKRLYDLCYELFNHIWMNLEIQTSIGMSSFWEKNTVKQKLSFNNIIIVIFTRPYVTIVYKRGWITVETDSI